MQLFKFHLKKSFPQCDVCKKSITDEVLKCWQCDTVICHTCVYNTRKGRYINCPSCKIINNAGHVKSPQEKINDMIKQVMFEYIDELKPEQIFKKFFYHKS
jgi:hypothetical protein